MPGELDEILGRAAKLDTFTLAKLPDGSVLIENPLGLTQLQFTNDQWRQAVAFIDHDDPKEE